MPASCKIEVLPLAAARLSASQASAGQAAGQFAEMLEVQPVSFAAGAHGQHAEHRVAIRGFAFGADLHHDHTLAAAGDVEIGLDTERQVTDFIEVGITGLLATVVHFPGHTHVVPGSLAQPGSEWNGRELFVELAYLDLPGVLDELAVGGAARRLFLRLLKGSSFASFRMARQKEDAEDESSPDHLFFASSWRSISEILSTRCWWRPPANCVLSQVSTILKAWSSWRMRAPMASTLASLCSRDI